MISHPPNPSRRELREFGLITGGLFIAIFGAALPWLRHRHYPVWPWLLGAFLILSALVAPPVLKPCHRVWNLLGWALGWVNSRIVMTLVFYVVIVPMGLIMRALGRDPMARGFDPKVASYRVASRAISKQSMDKPF
jgi:hypothetical protein